MPGRVQQPGRYTLFRVVAGRTPRPIGLIDSLGRPFQKAVASQFPDNGPSVSESLLVPSDKWLVIETVSLSGVMAADQQLTLWGITTALDGGMTHALNISSTAILPTINSRVYSASSPRT